MERISKDNLIYCFTKNQTNNKDELYIVKDKTGLNNSNILAYDDDFESLLKFSLPTKNRKFKQLISFNDCEDIINKISYGVLSFTYQDIPYSVALNHVYMDGKFYFHCAKSGFKLNGINSRVSYLVIEDLGVNSTVGTHNHKSVAVYGMLNAVTDFNEKQNVLKKLINDLAPTHPLNDQMINNTNIMVIIPDYVNGKCHIR